MAKQKALPKVILDDNGGDSAMFDELAGKPETREIRLIDPHLIDPSPQQIRTIFDPADIEEFANVMREVGFTSIIWVRPHPTTPGRYMLIFGERRWRAAQLVVQDPKPKFTQISCEVRADIVEPELLEFLGFFENSQRTDLPPYDEAVYYRKLLNRRDGQGKPIYTIEKLAVRAHVTENHVRDRLFLLDLPADALEAYKQNPYIALRSLREVCRLEHPGQRAPWLAMLVQDAISRETLRKSVQELLDGATQIVEEANVPQVETKAPNTEPLNASTKLPSAEIQDAVSSQATEAALQREQGVPFTAAEPALSASSEMVQEIEKGRTNTSSPEYRKGQLQSLRIMVSRDSKTLQAILSRWEGFLSQDEEIAGIILEGLAKATELFSDAQQRASQRENTLS